jgi:hypothetical protein
MKAGQKQGQKVTDEDLFQKMKELCSQVEASLICPVHRKHPKITLTKLRGRRFATGVKGCCSDIENRAQAELSYAW